VRPPSFHWFIGASGTVAVVYSSSEESRCACKVVVASHPYGRLGGLAGDLVPEAVADVPHRSMRFLWLSGSFSSSHGSYDSP